MVEREISNAGRRNAISQKNNFVFQFEGVKFEESNIYFDYTNRQTVRKEECDKDQEFDRTEYDDEDDDDYGSDNEGPMVTEGHEIKKPSDFGTPGFRTRLWKIIDDIKILIEDVTNVFMSPGS